ncbi:MAG: SGNH/GDSL hydrolase family protein [Verrucomicrobia bacterium]|nr:SGNH/GDSL hydrolase family protein [Verrucomicrobiota bacterium]
MLFRLLAVGLAVGLTGLLIEGGLRLAYYIDFKRGGDLHRRLERSQQTALGRTRGGLDMSGLVQPSAHADIVYELKPDIDGSFRGKDLRTNKHRFRGTDVTVDKPAGVKRIVGIGDSVMFGWGVTDDEYYLRELEVALNARAAEGQRYECLNLAVPGYNTCMEVATLAHKGLAFDPDLVLIQFINNDFGLPLFMERPRTGLALNESYLLSMIRRRLSWSTGTADTYLVGVRDKTLSKKEMRRTAGHYYDMVGASGFERAMLQLARLTGHALPEGGGEAAKYVPVVFMRGTMMRGQGELIELLCKRYGFELLDIGPYTTHWMGAHGYSTDPGEIRKTVRIGPGDTHPNPLGHKIYAAGLVEKLQALGFVP